MICNHIVLMLNLLSINVSYINVLQEMIAMEYFQ